MTSADALLLGSCTVRGIISEPMTCWVGQPTRQLCCRGNCNLCSWGLPLFWADSAFGAAAAFCLMVRLEFSRGVYRPESGWGFQDVSQVKRHGHSEVTVATLRDDVFFGSVVALNLACSAVSE